MFADNARITNVRIIIIIIIIITVQLIDQSNKSINQINGLFCFAA